MTDRIITAHLADPTHKLPVPNGGGRLFSTADEGEQIDTWDPFWIGVLKDGSIVAGPRPKGTADQPHAG